MPTTRITRKVSDLISTQLPEHITSEFPVFKTFIEKYYNYIEQDQQAQEILQNALLYSDIDSTINSLLDVFSEQFTKNIPKDILADKKLFVKLASELYTRKGTEEAYRIFFRALFNEEIDFFYPSTVILKSSDGKWEIPHIIRVKPISGSPFDLASTKITGNTSSANAIIESVISFESGQNTIFELNVNENSIEGQFQAGENIIGAKLTNAQSGAKIVTSAQIYSILRSVDVIYGATGYSVNDPITISGTTGTGAKGFVGEVSNSGSINKITISNYGYDYITKPNITIGSPTAAYSGIFQNSGNIATIRLKNDHGLTIGSNVNVTFTGNIYNSLNNQTKKLTVKSIVDNKTFTSDISSFITSEILSSSDTITIDVNVISIDFTQQFLQNTKGNVNLTHTLEKFFLTPFRLKNNIIRLSVPIDHGLKIGDNVKLLFNSFDKEIYTGNFVLKDYSNVTIGFAHDHGLDITEKINVKYDSNYVNTTSGIYVLEVLYKFLDSSNNIITIDSNVFSADYINDFLSNARISFTAPHFFITDQLVNVTFLSTITNSISGSYILEQSNVIATFNERHNFVLNENVIAKFNTAILTDENDTIQIKGNANIQFASNILLGNDTTFTSNIYTGNVISLDFINHFTVANVASNTLVYLTSNSEQTLTFANVYLATSNLAGNVSEVTVNYIPNQRKIYFGNILGKANAIGNITISSNVADPGFEKVVVDTTYGPLLASNSNVTIDSSNITIDSTVIIVAQNSYIRSFATGTVFNNGWPTYNFIDVTLPINLAAANSRGIAIVRNEGTSNIIGNYANNITISSIPTPRSIIFNSNISSNLMFSNGTATVTVSLPSEQIIKFDGSLTLILGDNISYYGDVTVINAYDFKNHPNWNQLMREYTVASVPNTKSITVSGLQEPEGFPNVQNTRGKLFIEFNKLANLQANIGAVGIGSGNWIDHSSILDETFKLQGRIDNSLKVYYQPFSYVIRSTKALSVWENAVKRTIHPAGMEIFSEVSITTSSKDTQKVTAKAKFFPIKILGNVDASLTSILIDSIEYTIDNDFNL